MPNKRLAALTRKVAFNEAYSKAVRDGIAHARDREYGEADTALSVKVAIADAGLRVTWAPGHYTANQ